MVGSGEEEREDDGGVGRVTIEERSDEWEGLLA